MDDLTRAARWRVRCEVRLVTPTVFEMLVLRGLQRLGDGEEREEEREEEKSQADHVCSVSLRLSSAGGGRNITGYKSPPTTRHGKALFSPHHRLARLVRQGEQKYSISLSSH